MSEFRYILAFGSNLGDRESNCNLALQWLSQHGHLLRKTPVVRTEPLRSAELETADHEYFLNFVAEFRSSLDPHRLYEVITTIENRLGHSRQRRWAPRGMDIDILRVAHDDRVSFEECTPVEVREPMPGLCIPHRELQVRDFWQALLTQL